MRNLNDLEPKRALELFADWTDRIAAGELPKRKTVPAAGRRAKRCHHLWDWAAPRLICMTRSPPTSAIRRSTPTARSTARPRTARISCRSSTRCASGDRNESAGARSEDAGPMFISTAEALMLRAVAILGHGTIWDSQTTVHNPMFDDKGRVWFTSRIRPPANPAFCKKGSEHPSAKLFPMNEPDAIWPCTIRKTKKFTLIDTCFSTHHLVFAEDANNTLWISSGGAASGMVGWLNTKMFERPATSRSRRAGRRSSSTPTATASATNMSSPINRSIRRKTNESWRAFTASAVNPGRRFDLGLGAGISRRRGPAQSR